MLVALDSNDKRTVASPERKGKTFCCPGCLQPVILKVGSIVIPHFAHRANSNCSYALGESHRHLEMKSQIGKIFEQTMGVDFEVPFPPDHRADVLLKDGTAKIVVECQVSPISITEWVRRITDYNRLGCWVLWIWDISRIGNKWNNSPISYLREDLQLPFEYKIPAEVSYCYRHSFGKFYVLNLDGEIYAYHPYFNSKTLVTYETLLSPLDMKPAFSKAENGQYLKMVGLGEPKFWKEKKEY